MTGRERNAPVSAAGEREIAATPREVWALMTAVEDWPSWNPDVRWARVRGPVKPGVDFVWKAGPGTIRSTFTDVEEPRRLSWIGTTLGIRAVHVWRIEPSSSGTRVTTEESWSGWPALLLPSVMRRSLQSAIDRGLRALQAAAEH